MWDANKQERFSVLWERKFNGVLTQSEQTELDSLINELDQLECEMLQPAFARLDKESKRMVAQNAMIESLLKEREQLLQRAMNQIQQLLQEHIQLKAKTASILND
jgi:hypothetical protein